MVFALAAAGVPALDAAGLDVRCQGKTLRATVVPDPAKPIDRVDFTIAGFEYDYSDYDAPFEIGLVEGPSTEFRVTAALYYQGTRVATLRSGPLRLCGSRDLATLVSKCVGTGAYAKVTPTPGTTLQRVAFSGAYGGTQMDSSPPYEVWFTPASMSGIPPYRSDVRATAYAVGARPQELVSKGRMCPAVVRRRPPLVSKIVEGLSLGGVAVGMHWGEVEEAWGTPDRKACHGSGDGGQVCDFDTRGGRNGPLQTFHGPRDAIGSVRVHTEGAERPKYRRWKTSKGIGLGSSRAQLERAYGAALKRVLYRYAAKLGEDERPYYLVTLRGGTRWVTVFSVPVRTSASQTYKPYQLNRIGQIELLSVAAFRRSWANYAPPGWKP